MRRHFTSCLAVASLLLGSGGLRAQDVETYVSQDYEADGVVADWTTNVAGRYDPILQVADDNHFIMVDETKRTPGKDATLTGTTFLDAEGTPIVAAGTDFTLTFDMMLLSANQKNVDFYVQDVEGGTILRLYSAGAWSSDWTVNNGPKVTLPSSGATANAQSTLPWYTYKIVRKTYGEYVVTFASIVDRTSKTVILPYQVVPTLSTVGGLGKIIGYLKASRGGFGIDNVKVTSVASDDIPSVDPIVWSVKYVNEEGDSINTPVESLGFPDDVIEASAAQTADFFDANGDKWIYVEGNAQKSLSETEKEIILVYRKAAKLHYTINAVGPDGNILKELANDSTFEKETVSAAFPQNFLVENNVLLAASPINKEYNLYLTATEDNQVGEVKYAKSLDYVALYSEAEDVDGLTREDAATINIRGSQSAGAYAEADTAIATLQPGSYKLTFATFRQAADGQLWFQVGKEGTDTIRAAVSGGNWIAPQNPDTVITVTEPTTLYMLQSGSAKSLLDYFYARYVTANVKVNYIDVETNDTLKVDNFEAATFAASGKKYILPESYLAAITGSLKLDSSLVSTDTIKSKVDPAVDSVYVENYDYTFNNFVCIGGNDSIAVVGDGTDEITLQYVDDRTEYQVVKVDPLDNVLVDYGWTAGKVNEKIVLPEEYEDDFVLDEAPRAYRSGNEGLVLVKDKTQNVIKLVFAKANVPYSVKFLNKDTNESLKEDVTGFKVHGDVMKATAAQQADITIDEKVYSLYAPADSIVIDETAENILSLYFGLTTKLTVNTVDEDNNVLVDAKEYAGLFVGDSAAAEEASLADITINENLYQLASGNDTIVLADAANAINLVFAQKTAHYTVNFINQDDNSLLKDAVVTAGATVGDSVAPMLSQVKTLLSVAGIDYVCTISDPKEAAILVGKVDSVNVINLYFRQNTTTYTVNFVADVDDSRVLKTAVTIAGVKPGDKIAAAKELLADIKDAAVTGETFTYASGNDTIVLDADATKNVITLVFTQKTTTYKIAYVDENGKALTKAREAAGNVGETVKAKNTDKSKTFGDNNELVFKSSDEPEGGLVLTADASKNVITLVFAAADTEAIVYISADKAKANGPIYSLNGAIVVNPGRGLYIQNGQFIMIK